MLNMFYSLQETSVIEDLPVHCRDTGSRTKNNYLWQSYDKPCVSCIP